MSALRGERTGDGDDMRRHGRRRHVHREREAGASRAATSLSAAERIRRSGAVESGGRIVRASNKAVNLAKLTVREDPLGKRRAGADAEGDGEA